MKRGKRVRRSPAAGRDVREEPEMNQEMFASRWAQARGKAKQWWSELSDETLDRVQGNKDQLITELQAKYGYTKEQAEQDIDRRMAEAA